MSAPKRYRPVIVRGEPKFAQDETGDFTTLSEYYLQRDRADRFESIYHKALKELECVRKENICAHAEISKLQFEVEHLRQAEHLVIWDGQRWNVRPEHGGKQL